MNVYPVAGGGFVVYLSGVAAGATVGLAAAAVFGLIVLAGLVARQVRK